VGFCHKKTPKSPTKPTPFDLKFFKKKKKKKKQ